MRSQGQFGANYSVNGHRTSGERRVDFNKGYSFLFERCFEENTLEEIEKIDWSHVTVKTLDANYPPCSLPEGYSFVVKDIQYIKCYDSFEVTIEVDKQYWGDVTPYQAQIAELTAVSEAKDSELSEKNALIAEKAQQIAQKDSKIAEMADAEQAAKIDTYGKYGTTGTKLQVRGTFHLVCTEHEGLTDLHADIVTVVEKGKHHEDEFDVNAFVPGAIATALGLALMGVFYYLRERQR